MDSAVWLSFVPVLWPSLGALACLVLAPRGRGLALAVGGIGLAVLAVWVMERAVRGLGPWDALSSWFLSPVLLLGALESWALWAEGKTAWSSRAYPALFFTFVATLALVPVVSGLFLLWAAVEATTLVSVFLVAHEGTRSALAAAWKYLTLATMGGLLALMGTALVAAGGHVAGATWWTNAAVHQGKVSAVLLGFAVAAVGFGTKAGLAPMHTWLPDAHSEAPGSVSALLSGMELSLALYALARLRQVAIQIASPWPDRLLVAFGLVSLAVAALLVFSQKDLKRLLAYSSVENMGLLALSLGLGGPALAGGLVQVWTHAVTKAGLFTAAGVVRRKLGSSRLTAMQGLPYRLPLTAGGLGLGLWAMAGLPPFGPFLSEWALLVGAARESPWVAVGTAALLALVAAGLGRQGLTFLAGPPPSPSSSRRRIPERFSEAAPVWAALALSVLAGLVPLGAIPSWLAKTAQALTGGWMG